MFPAQSRPVHLYLLARHQRVRRHLADDGEKRFDAVGKIDRLENYWKSPRHVGKAIGSNPSRRSEAFDPSPDGGPRQTALAGPLQQNLIETTVPGPVVFAQKDHDANPNLVDWHLSPPERIGRLAGASRFNIAPRPTNGWLELASLNTVCEQD